MENMWSVLMEQNSCIVAAIIGIARNVRPPVDKKDALSGTRGEAFRKNRPRITSTNDKDIERLAPCRSHRR